jgi:hypothetical protein
LDLLLLRRRWHLHLHLHALQFCRYALRLQL